MNPVRMSALAVTEAESTAQVRSRVASARHAATERWRPHGFRTNAEVSGALLRRRFRLGAAAMEPLRTALDRGLLSIRGLDRTLRVAWTLADLAGRTSPGLDEVASALCFRQPGTAR
jgi:magnesium chelatase family protein